MKHRGACKGVYECLKTVRFVKKKQTSENESGGREFMEPISNCFSMSLGAAHSSLPLRAHYSMHQVQNWKTGMIQGGFMFEAFEAATYFGNFLYDFGVIFLLIRFSEYSRAQINTMS